MKNYIIFGAPGAGKGTQAEIIAHDKGLEHLSSGELSRRMLDDKILGPKIKKRIDSGQLVPDYIIIELVEKYVRERLEGNGFIFDGYPRNLSQAKALDKFIRREKLEINLVINLKLSEEEALKRILLRGQSSGRSDDNIKTTKNRLKIYRERTEPILEYYREKGILKELDGYKPIEKVAQEIKKFIK